MSEDSEEVEDGATLLEKVQELRLNAEDMLQDSEELSDGQDSTSDLQRSSEDTEEMDNNAFTIDSDTTMNSTDADGLEECLELEPSKDSKEETTAALSGKRVHSRR